MFNLTPKKTLKTTLEAVSEFLNDIKTGIDENEVAKHNLQVEIDEIAAKQKVKADEIETAKKLLAKLQ